MDRLSDESESRFAAYVGGLFGAIGHVDRTLPLRDYCLGLLLPGARKSVEPMAALTAPGRVPAQHQSLLHFVGNAPWSDERVPSKVRDLVLPSLERHGPIVAWIIDDTGFPKPSPGDSSDVRAARSREGRRKSSGVSDTVRLRVLSDWGR